MVFLRFKNFRSTEEGFTLVELLVVIIIIGVLAAIALPIFLNQQRAAADAALKADVKQLALVLSEWQVKNVGERFPNLAVNWRNTAVEGAWSHDTDGLRSKLSFSDGTRVNVRNINGGSEVDGVGFCIQASNDGSNYTGEQAVAGKRLYYESGKGFTSSC